MLAGHGVYVIWGVLASCERTCMKCHRGEEKVELSRYFVFFEHKKYSCRIIKFRLHVWWQMDYFDDVFHTFMDLDSAIYYAVNGTVTSLPVFIWNVLNCVQKTKEAFTGLERHGGKWSMTKKKIILGWSNPFSSPRLYLFDQKYSKNSNILKYYYSLK